MKVREMSRVGLASVLSLSAALGLSACTRDYTVAYAYATTAKPLTAGSRAGAVVSYAVDYQSGALTQLANSPVPAGINPVTLVAHPNDKEIYVVNHDDHTISPFAIGTDGKLYPGPVANITGLFPTAAAVDQAGTFLYVTFTFQLNSNNKGPGGVTIFPINKDNSLGTPSTLLLGVSPVAIATGKALSKSFVYVIDQEASPNATVLGFAQNSTSGALTAVPGTVLGSTGGVSTATGFRAGIIPSAATIEASGHFLYVTDQAANQVYTYVINSGNGALTILDPATQTGTFPVGITSDPRGKYVYVVNYTSATVNAFIIDQATGRLTGSVGSGGTAVKTGPTCVAIEPARGIYLFTSNNLDGTISAEELDPHNGGLKEVQNTPFPASGLPTCVVTVANGAHATALVNP